MACCGNSGILYEKKSLEIIQFEQVVIIRELNHVAGKPSDRASPWTMEEEHKVPQAVKFSFPIL